MIAARLHAVGSPMQLDELPLPAPRPLDVLVRVRACGVVPNLSNVLAHASHILPELCQPKLPAIYGLDAVGEIAAIGEQVHGIEVGTRVYVNPGRSCGSCAQCRRGNTNACQDYALQGYFACRPEARQTLDDYPYGGLGQYLTAPVSAMVPIPDNVTFDQAARFGYLGTMYSALLKANAGPGTTILVNGISGTLGIGGALLGLAMGVDRIYGTGRDRALLERVKGIAQDRIEVFSLADGSIARWVRRRVDEGVDAHIDCMGPGADPVTFADAMRALRRGGISVNIGAIGNAVPIDLHSMMDNGITLHGSGWFTTDEAVRMAALAATGALDMSIFKTQGYPLSKVNEAISGTAKRDGGFSNFVVRPDQI
ncbi:MAG: alcohol dehydrogenase [Rhodospirillaceae bacterium]|nr:MAG: alcohol dehydrogenase [Rhodospirillaceae bacterium]